MLKFFTNPVSNILKICLFKNIEKSKFHDFTHAWGMGVGGGYRNEKILKFVTSTLLKSLTTIRTINKFSQLIYKNEAQKYA